METYSHRLTDIGDASGELNISVETLVVIARVSLFYLHNYLGMPSIASLSVVVYTYDD
jgi:hypothetical protein